MACMAAVSLSESGTTAIAKSVDVRRFGASVAIDRNLQLGQGEWRQTWLNGRQTHCKGGSYEP